MPTPEQNGTPELDVIGTCKKINVLLRSAPFKGGRASMDWLAKKLKMELTEVSDFLSEYRHFLDHEVYLWGILTVKPEEPPEPEIPEGLPAVDPIEQELAKIINQVDTNLQRGLQAIGLSPVEAKQAEALQEFNKEQFQESMHMISANTLRTSLKLAVQQRIIEERLVVVREQIKTCPPQDPQWLENREKCERMLVEQLVECGKLLNEIHGEWYKSSAALAILKMRMRSGAAPGFPTQRSNRPGFRAAVDLDNQNEFE